MRILMVSPVFLPKQDGTVRLIQNVARGLGLRGHHVTLVTRVMRRVPDYENIEKVRVFRVPPLGSTFLGRMKFIMNSAALMAGLSTREKFDVIHAFGSSALAACLMGNIRRIPITTTFPGVAEEVLVGYDPQRAIKFAAGSGLQVMSLGVRHITVPTSNAALSIRRKIGKFNSGKLTVIPNPIDLSVFISRTSERIERMSSFYPEILAVGNLSYRKGFDILVKAFPGVLKQFETARLTIVGRGPRQAELTQLAKDIKVESRVRFMSDLSDESLADTYSSCDLFVLPSRAGGEAFGYALVEAMAARRPVIATSTPGPKEIIERSGSGLLVEPENEVALTTAIIELCKDKERSKQMGERGVKYVVTNFDLLAIASSFEKLYNA